VEREFLPLHVHGKAVGPLADLLRRTPYPIGQDRARTLAGARSSPSMASKASALPSATRSRRVSASVRSPFSKHSIAKAIVTPVRIVVHHVFRAALVERWQSP